jgi:phosphohistidine phosphatase SixA
MRTSLAVLIGLLATSTASAQQASGGQEQSTGALGIEAARAGGTVIACRHAITANTEENELTLRFDDPSTQRRLSAEGERQAAAMGRAFRQLRIPVGEVITSPLDRARRTGELMFGEVRTDSTWFTRGDAYGGPTRDQRAELLGTPVERGNRVIISHVGTLSSVIPSIRGRFGEGDCVVLRPRGESRHDVIAVVPWRAWLQAAGVPVP